MTALFSTVLFYATSVNAEADLRLHWKAPKQFFSGDRLNVATDLKEYRLYYGSSVEAIKDHVVIVNPAKNSVALSALDLSKLKSSIVYFAMTSVLLGGSESELSPSIFYLP